MRKSFCCIAVHCVKQEGRQSLPACIPRQEPGNEERVDSRVHGNDGNMNLSVGRYELVMKLQSLSARTNEVFWKGAGGTFSTEKRFPRKILTSSSPIQKLGFEAVTIMRLFRCP
jgi:hypothetical protein